MRCLDVCLGFFVFENLLLLPRGFGRSPGWWSSLCVAFCVLGFFVLENLLLLLRVFGGPLVEFPLLGFVRPVFRL